MPDLLPYVRHRFIASLNQIQDSIYRVVAPLQVTAWRTAEPVPFEQRFYGQELALRVGDKWGDLFDCAWFRFNGQIPDAAAGQPVVALLDVNGEMCVVDDAGAPVRGLTNVSSDFDSSLGQPGKRVLPLTSSAEAGTSVELWADAGCNDLFGNLRGNGTVREAALAVCQPHLRALYYDFEVLLDSLQVLPENSPRHQQIQVALYDVIHLLDAGRPYLAEAVQRARERLAQVLQRRAGDPSLEISAIGQAHLDLAWLWPIRETKRKAARSFATALAQMTDYPDYVFGASQAQLFQWLKEAYPGLYGRVKTRVREGRLEPQGALWVECDANLVSGESLVRQILYGRQFFRKEFGVDVAYLWLPDTFGFTAALPQIVRASGMRYFLTQKLSWSVFNQFPHDSFHWQGIDGSQVLVHLLPEDTYNSPAAPRSIGKIEANYQQNGVSGHALMVFGIGDGGGGPGEEHLERLARLKDFAGLSPVKQATAAEFFEAWSRDAARFPTWVGELYLERHQGTLTTCARNKWCNRRLEQALRDWEWLAWLASRSEGLRVPAERLAAIWKEVLLYQFHDILPGTSIKRVADETAQRYQVLLAEVEAGIRACQAAVARSIDTSGIRSPVVVFNSLSWERTQWLKPAAAWIQVTMPPMGYAVVDAEQAEMPVAGLVATPNRLENDRLCVRFDTSGAIISLYDKVAHRDAMPAGQQANRLAVYRDTGDAWDFPVDYARSEPRHMQLASAEARLDGPRAVLVQTYRLGHSRLIQEISLMAGCSVVEFATHATWRETQSMLRTSFPLAIQAVEATYDIQFGTDRRPTHRNTTWDLGRDEVVAHKWVDLSQRDYGVSLLNDSKYGHRVKGHVIDVNLIRSVPYPGPRDVQEDGMGPGEPHPGYTDQTDHEFRYGLYLHSGDAIAGDAMRAGYEFNMPLRLVEAEPHTGPQPAHRSCLRVDHLHVIVETVKRAEADDGWVVRLYEASGGSARARLEFGWPVQHVELTDLMEERVEALRVKANKVELDFRPFEIKTLHFGP